MTNTKKESVVSREAFEKTFMEFQEQFRKELRKAILDDTKTVTGLEKKGMLRAAKMVWNEEDSQ